MPGILRLAIPVPLHRVFDYLPPPGVDISQLQPGVRVSVPFGHGAKTGILVEVTASSELDPDRLRHAIAILDALPLLSGDDIRLITWSSRYYHYPLGEAMAAALSTPLRRGKPATPGCDQRLYSHETEWPAPREPLKRAPRQSALWAWLIKSPQGLTARQLREQDPGYISAAKALIEKGLAQWRDVTADALAPGLHEPTQPPPPLNERQQDAVTSVLAALDHYQAFLLDGVTGSGKTEVYLRLAEAVLARGQQVMVLLPEINLTPQLEARFRARFAAPVVIFHSALSDGERQRAWMSMQGGRAAILLGTRSAVFTPAKNLGLIVLDEEHDPSFKQQEGFRFSARDVAIMRARFNNIPVLMGSATPSLESLHNVSHGRYQRLELPFRAGGAAKPHFQILDIRAQHLNEGLSSQLANRIAETLAQEEQVLLFVNRRGFAPVLMCHDCGWLARCRHCDANLVLHAGENRLRCHHCGHEQTLPRACPSCHSTRLRPLGLGTERVEAALATLFPKSRIVRIDRDSTRRKGSLQRVLDDVHQGRADILVGTQMLAKGHHFPNVTLVGILDVDAGFYSTDFRAEERTAQLIIQVAGRAGRESKPGTVILQTRHPHHPLLDSLVRQGYPAFAHASLAERERADLPPCSHQVLWRAEALNDQTAQDFLSAISRLVLAMDDNSVLILGPAPAPLARRSNRYRWQLLMQSSSRNRLHYLLDQLTDQAQALDPHRKVRWSIDVDPGDLY